MDETIFHRVTPTTRLHVTGSDAATFLQGQFSNELRRTEGCPATYGLWLNHKGRPLADSQVLQRAANEFEIVSLRSRVTGIRERLEAYIIADDVVIEDRTAGCFGVVIAGERAAGAVRELGFAVPPPRCFAAADACVLIPARTSEAPSWCVIGPAASIDVAVARLEAMGMRAAASEEFDRRRIRAGIPAVPDELGPDDLPMEGGLEHDAISFTKGCYLGQEVMARLHNLGQVRRRLFIVESEGGTGLPPKGAVLFSGAQKVGEIRTSVAADGSGNAIGLAMLQTHAVQVGAVLALDPSGPPRIRVERLAEGRAP
jgi:folate-binding protein YgfZ